MIITNFTPFTAIAGGLLLGLSAVLLLAFNGRIAGISGIFNGALDGARHDIAWRWWFLTGMIAGAGLYLVFAGVSFEIRSGFSLPILIVAGFLVGFGTRMGSGCTSGHGICGIGRLSVRSILATITFLSFGMITVYFVRHLFGIAT